MLTADALRLPRALEERLRACGLRFLVTGASGWIGMATLEMLFSALGADAAQRVIAFGSAPRVLALRNGTRVQQRPLADLQVLAPAPTMLLHYAFLTRDRVAGMPLEDYVSRNRAISDLVESCARSLGVTAALVLSSGAVYTRDGGLVTDFPTNPYGALKLEDEIRFSRWAEDTGAALVLPRLFNLSGPYINKLDTYALATLIRATQRGEHMRIRAAHTVVRSYTAVADLLATALWRLSRNQSGAWRFDTAGETEIEIGDLAQLVRQTLGSTSGIERPPRDPVGIDRYVGEGAAYAALLAEAGITPQALARQIVNTAADLERRFP